MRPRSVPEHAKSLQQRVTLYAGTRKYEATHLYFWIEEAPRNPKYFHSVFKPRRARNYRHLFETKGATVVLEGWDHPEFDWLLRSLEEAPSEQLRPGLSVKVAAIACYPGQEQPKNKFELEFESYLETIDRARILVDTRVKSDRSL
jgi:hypothetical protein